MLVNQPHLRRSASRMGEFFAVNASWQRRLWGVGLSLALRELSEASSSAAGGTLRQSSIKWYSKRLTDALGADPGVGGTRQLAELRRCLSSELVADSVEHRELTQITADVHEHYLERWAVCLEAENHGYNAERIARALASHLLDHGISHNHLHRWLTWSCEHDSDEHDLPSLIRQADKFVRRPHKEHRVFVAMQSEFPGLNNEPKEWLRRERAEAWLHQQQLGQFLEGVEIAGAILLRIHAADPESAVDQAAEIIDGLSARISVGTRGSLLAHGEALVAESQRRFPLRRSRRVEVRALERQGLLGSDLYQLHGHPIDSALQLLSHLDSSPSETAVAGGWSAVESLLTAPGDEANVAAADRIATIVACSWPRAELTTLAWERIKSVQDPLTFELRGMPDNRARAERVAQAILAGEPLGLREAASECAIKRMEKLFRAPRAVLLDVQGYATDAVRRLYRNRNLVLHGGQTRAVALSATLRTAAPLVGAGIDRIVHAQATRGEHPLDVAARAAIAIQVADEGERPLTRLLE